MEILPVSASNNIEASTAGNPVKEILLNWIYLITGNDVGAHLSSSVVKATCSYSKLKDIFKASIKELKKAMNIQDILSHALINKIFLKEHQVYDCKQIKLKIYVEGDC
ncbi:hypothetical protein Tco_0172016 [Tanacetum coccineum]